MVNIERNGQATITSPNYPQEYDNLYECDWVIMAEKGRRLGLEFHDFVTEMKAVSQYLTCKSLKYETKIRSSSNSSLKATNK